jgi:hypothetical protein
MLAIAEDPSVIGAILLVLTSMPPSNIAILYHVCTDYYGVIVALLIYCC